MLLKSPQIGLNGKLIGQKDHQFKRFIFFFSSANYAPERLNLCYTGKKIQAED